MTMFTSPMALTLFREKRRQEFIEHLNQEFNSFCHAREIEACSCDELLYLDGVHHYLLSWERAYLFDFLDRWERAEQAMRQSA